jgi:superfamily I DNA and/or RNA helicase
VSRNRSVVFDTRTNVEVFDSIRNEAISRFEIEIEIENENESKTKLEFADPFSSSSGPVPVSCYLLQSFLFETRNGPNQN